MEEDTVKWSSSESLGFCTRGMIHNKIHPISPGCPQPSIALQVQKRGLEHHSFILKVQEYSVYHLGIAL